VSTDIGDTSPWIKAAKSGANENCVEMRRHSGAIEVRDSKNPDGPSLRYTSCEFVAWLDGAKNGDFDHLA
jgi:hypothetical protein